MPDEVLVMLFPFVMFPPIVAFVISEPALMLVSEVLVFCAAAKLTARIESIARTGRTKAIFFLMDQYPKNIFYKFLNALIHNKVIRLRSLESKDHPKIKSDFDII